MSPSRPHPWWLLLLTLLGLTVWVSAVGTVRLYGLPLTVLESLAEGRGLVPASGWPSATSLLSLLPGDPTRWASLAVAALHLLAALVTGAAAWTLWRHLPSVTLVVAAAFLGGPTLWVEASTPAQSALHLLLALALLALARGSLVLLVGVILGLAPFEPAQAVMLYLALAGLAHHRRKADGDWLAGIALVGTGCLLIPLAPGYRLEPSAQGFWLWGGLALALACGQPALRQKRGPLYACLVAGALLTGTAELASLLAWGDLAWQGRAETEPAPVAEGSTAWPPATLRLSRGTLSHGIATLAFLAISLPGERYLNRQILIPAQKARVPLSALLVPFSLQDHAQHLPTSPWRQGAPYPPFLGSDAVLALELSRVPLDRGLCPVTLGSPDHDRLLGLLYALISGQRLGGWDSPEHQAGPLWLCRLQRANVLHQGPEVIFRTEAGATRTAPAPLPPKPSALDLRHVQSSPYRRQRVSRDPGSAYRWESGPESYVVSFLEAPAEVLLTSAPGTVRISSLTGTARRELDVPPISWSASGLPHQQTLPSRSLISLQLRLTNTGRGPFGSELIRAWRLETSDPSFSPFLQENPKPFLLYPQETVTLTLELATPEPEGRTTVRLTAITPEGTEIPVSWEGNGEVSTWRRLPPVGTWLEEP